MLRALFEKTGTAVWISHLDLMRLFQRAFARANLPLKHTQGFNPRPSVSIALPLSVGLESVCELLDFEVEGNFTRRKLPSGSMKRSSTGSGSGRSTKAAGKFGTWRFWNVKYFWNMTQGSRRAPWKR